MIKPHGSEELTPKIVNTDEEKESEIKESLETSNKELEALEMIMNKVNTYRTNTFVYLRDKEDIDKMISYIRIYKEQSD